MGGPVEHTSCNAVLLGISFGQVTEQVFGTGYDSPASPLSLCLSSGIFPLSGSRDASHGLSQG